MTGQTSEDKAMSNACISLAIELAREHEAAANEPNTTDKDKRAHLKIARALDKAGGQMTAQNMPRYGEDGVYFVDSFTHRGTTYRVDLKEHACNCQNGRDCWHLAAAYVVDQVRTMQPHKSIAVNVPVVPEYDNDLDALIDDDLDGLGMFMDEKTLHAPAGITDPHWILVELGRQWQAQTEDGKKWARCASSVDAATIVALMNRDADVVAVEYLKSNGALLITYQGRVIGMADSAETANDIDTKWFVAWIPF
jgi:hypothetical protein